MDPKVFQSIRRIVHERSGINIKENRASMVSARIATRLRNLELDSESDYLAYLQSNTQEVTQLLDVISTNVTRFFREQPHYDFAHELISERIRSGVRRLRVWSAASSTGQEPYSLCMTAAEAIKQAGGACDFRLLATDISTRVLERARAGRYSSEELQSVPDPLRARYFQAVDEGGDTAYQVVPRLREMAVFHRMNLDAPPFPMKGPLDLIFCCNVMIYFDSDTKRRLLEAMHRLLKPDGVLVVSHTESLIGVPDLFKMFKPSIYAKAPEPAEHAVPATPGAGGSD